MNYEITDYNYVLSSVGNAYFSGLTFEELWQCVSISETREQLDASIDATIKLQELTEKKGKHHE
jgi:hypothetical protein